MLLHGRAAYKRNTEVVWYAFYKNWIYNMVLMYFGFVQGKPGERPQRWLSSQGFASRCVPRPFLLSWS